MNQSAIETLLARAVASGNIAGVAAGVTTGGETILQATAGSIAVNGAQKITPETMFWIASMTKPVTSIAAMQLVEQGKLSLDKPIGTLLPDLANPMVLEAGKLRPARRPITLAHLLTHTSGFTYPFASAELAAYAAAAKIAFKYDNPEGRRMPLIFDPGERWEYGVSTDWVGAAVEAASGTKLDDYFSAHITGPLGMTDTCFVLTQQQSARSAALHRRREDGTLVPIPPMPQNTPSFLSGGAGLHSTLVDYLKFCRMILNGGEGIVSPATIAQMSTNQIGRLRAGVLSSADPRVSSGMDIYPGMDAKWGFGFLINPQTGPFGRSPGSLNWAGMANTYFWIDPVKNLAAVILMQILPAGDLGAMKTYWGFEKAVYAAAQ